MTNYRKKLNENSTENNADASMLVACINISGRHDGKRRAVRVWRLHPYTDQEGSTGLKASPPHWQDPVLGEVQQTGSLETERGYPAFITMIDVGRVMLIGDCCHLGVTLNIDLWLIRKTVLVSCDWISCLNRSPTSWPSHTPSTWLLSNQH